MVEDLLQPRHLLLILGLCVVVLFPFARIFKKAGYPAWLSLTMWIPPLGVVMLLWLALSRWPIETELERLRRHAPSAPD